MKYKLLIPLSLILLSITFILIKYGKSPMETIMAIKNFNITIVQYNDTGLWSDPIVNGFMSDLKKSQLNYNLNFKKIIWEPNADIASQIDKENTDIVFLTDDLFYDLYAKEISSKGIPILSINMYKKKEDFLKLDKEMGIYNDYPAKEVLTMANRFFSLKKVAYIAGPIDGAKKIAKIVKEQAPETLNIEEFYSDDWSEWKEKLKFFEKNYDAIWLVTPFLVKDGNNELDHQTFAQYIEKLHIPTIGFCTMKTEFKRTLTIGVDPQQLGLAAAAIFYRYLTTGNYAIEPYKSFDIAIHQHDLEKFNKKVPDDLTAFIK